MILATRQIIKVPAIGHGFISEYDAVYDFAIAQGWSPPVTMQGKLADNNLLKEAKANNLLANCNRLWNFHTTGDVNYACINYVSPSLATQTIVVGALTFTEKGGFANDGTSGRYLDYQWAASANGGTTFTQNDAGIMCYVGVNNTAAIFTVWACGTTGHLRLQPRVGNQNSSFGMNATNVGTVNWNNSGIGTYVIRRIVNTTSRGSVNGGNETPCSRVSTGLVASKLIGLAWNNTNTAGVYNPTSFFNGRKDCMIIYKGSAVTPAQLTAMWTNHRNRTAAV